MPFKSWCPNVSDSVVQNANCCSKYIAHLSRPKFLNASRSGVEIQERFVYHIHSVSCCTNLQQHTMRNRNTPNTECSITVSCCTIRSGTSEEALSYYISDVPKNSAFASRTGLSTLSPWSRYVHSSDKGFCSCCVLLISQLSQCSEL